MQRSPAYIAVLPHRAHIRRRSAAETQMLQRRPTRLYSHVESSRPDVDRLIQHYQLSNAFLKQ